FFNRALGAYPMGSSFKCYVAAAALDQRFPADTRFYCAGELDLSGQVYHCSGVHGMVDMSQAIARSCNLYFIQLARELQLQPMLDLLRLFGFGEGMELAPGMDGARGNMPGQEELALPGELANFSFGQGRLLGTPLQIAAATACLANGGVYRSPTLVLATVDETGAAAPYMQDREMREVVSPEIARQVRRMMVAAVEEGTAAAAKPETGGAGGKTATAQSGRLGRDGTELLQTGFTGFFPAEEPRYAVAVLRENGTSGAGDCGPVFKRIADGMRAIGL
ncbi:MAG: penicillin-binding transpeptidase domain-containing protein, partial [Firmicutes bacterium]|nr:penicillin-binding transpeptidase domain-containing protein [Bacillota bacterium]